MTQSENTKKNKQNDCFENNDNKTTNNKQTVYEDNNGNYKYRGFWSGFGDQ